MKYTILYNKPKFELKGKLRKKNTGFKYQFRINNKLLLMYLITMLNMKQVMVSKNETCFAYEPVPYKTGTPQLCRWHPIMEFQMREYVKYCFQKINKKVFGVEPNIYGTITVEDIKLAWLIKIVSGYGYNSQTGFIRDDYTKGVHEVRFTRL